MSRHLIILAIVVGAVVVLGLLVHAIRTEMKRKSYLQEIAQRLGMTFAGKDDGALAPLRGSTRLFDRGKRRRFANIMHGRIEDLTAYVFDYAYTTGSGDDQRRRTHTVAAFYAEASRAPAFELRPEHFMHRVASALGFEDIDIPDAPEFSKRFHLKGENKEAVQNAFPPDVTARVLGAKKVCIESTGQWLVIYRAGRRLKPREVELFLHEAFELVTLFV